VNRADQTRLMQLYDGELQGEEATAAERQLAQSAEWRAVYDGLAQVGDTVRLLVDARAARADGIAHGVMQQISAERAARRAPAPLRVVEGGGSGRSAAQPPGRLVDGLGRGRRVVGALAAVAASAVLLFRLAPSPQEARSGVRLAVNAPGSRAQPLPSGASTPAAETIWADEFVPGASIESVDFGTRNGTVFMISAGEYAIPVVWLVDEPALGEGTMDPL